MSRFQKGSIRLEKRVNHEVWVFRYYQTRVLDGKRVEHLSITHKSGRNQREY